MDEFLEEHYKKYKDKLENYTYINHDNLHLLKLGGKIKYIDLNGNLKYGGILIKIVGEDMYTRLKFILKNLDNYVSVSYSNNYIFFEPKPKKEKQIRSVFTELLNEFTKKK